jgi:hypothetical protein
MLRYQAGKRDRMKKVTPHRRFGKPPEPKTPKPMKPPKPTTVA